MYHNNLMFKDYNLKPIRIVIIRSLVIMLINIHHTYYYHTNTKHLLSTFWY